MHLDVFQSTDTGYPGVNRDQYMNDVNIVPADNAGVSEMTFTMRLIPESGQAVPDSLTVGVGQKVSI